MLVCEDSQKKATTQPPKCRHCRKRRATKEFGLCEKCFLAPQVKCQYGERIPQDKPTTHAPGSEAKIALLRDRLRRAEPLWHPGDLANPFPTEIEFWIRVIEKLRLPVFATQKKTMRWRAYPGNPNRPKRKEHLGYFATREEAEAEVVAWIAAGRPDGAVWRAQRQQDTACVNAPYLRRVPPEDDD